MDIVSLHMKRYISCVFICEIGWSPQNFESLQNLTTPQYLKDDVRIM